MSKKKSGRAGARKLVLDKRLIARLTGGAPAGHSKTTGPTCPLTFAGPGCR